MQEVLLFLQSHITVLGVIEIGVLTFLFYQIFGWIKGTQAEQVVKGLLILVVLMPICELIGFSTLAYLIRSMFTWIFLFIIIVFQPELRSALEQLGSNTFYIPFFRKSGQIQTMEKTITLVVESVSQLVQTKTGALILCEGKTGLKDIAATGIQIDAKVTPALLTNIFYDKAPLHDGAVIISLERDCILAAGCVLPLTNRRDLPFQFGTRHRAGIGISEQSDALIIIVSEETGKITVAQNGNYITNLTTEHLKERLLNQFVAPLMEKEDNGSWLKLRKKNTQDEQNE